MSNPTTLSPLFGLLDTPARSAARLADDRAYKVVALGVCGAAMIVAVIVAGSALTHGPDEVLSGRPLHFAIAGLQAIAIVLPSLMLLFTYVDAELDAATLLAATSTALVVSGVVVAAALPLVVYFVVMDQTGAARDIAFFPPALALVTFLVAFRRIALAFDARRSSRLLTDGALILVMGATFFRAMAH